MKKESDKYFSTAVCSLLKVEKFEIRVVRRERRASEKGRGEKVNKSWRDTN